MARAARSWEAVNSVYVEYKCSRIVAPHHFFVSELAMFTNNGKKAESVEMKREREKEIVFSRWHQRDTTMWSNFSPSRYHNDQDSRWRGVVWALKAVLSVIRAREAYKKSHKHEIGTIFHFKLSHVITLPFVTRYVDDLFLGSIRCDVIFFPRPQSNIMQRLIFLVNPLVIDCLGLFTFSFEYCQNDPRFKTAQVALKRRNSCVLWCFYIPSTRDNRF